MFALDVIELTKTLVVENTKETKLLIRVGLNSGPIVGGVVGTKRPHYALFGDTVNTASRMESTSSPSRIQCSEATYNLLRRTELFSLKPRGAVHVKGKGEMKTYWVTGMASDHLTNDSSSPCSAIPRNVEMMTSTTMTKTTAELTAEMSNAARECYSDNKEASMSRSISMEMKDFLTIQLAT